MPDLLIRELPEHLHQRLKARANKHRRSVAKEVILILEEAIGAEGNTLLPKVHTGKFQLTDEWLTTVHTPVTGTSKSAAYRSMHSEENV